MSCPCCWFCCLSKSSPSIEILDNNNIILQQPQPINPNVQNSVPNNIIIQQPPVVNKNIEKNSNKILFIFQVHQSQITTQHRVDSSSSSSNDIKVSIFFDFSFHLKIVFIFYRLASNLHPATSLHPTPFPKNFPEAV